MTYTYTLCGYSPDGTLIGEEIAVMCEEGGRVAKTQHADMVILQDTAAGIKKHV